MTITRRRALTTIAATSAVAIVPVIANAGVVDPHQAWMDRIEECTERRSELYVSGAGDDHSELRALHAEQDDLEAKIIKTRPRTLAGIDAKLRWLCDDWNSSKNPLLPKVSMT